MTDPSTKFVRSLDGEYWLLREAAQILQVDHRVLRKLNNEDRDAYGPSFFTMFGKVKIYLYTRGDLDKLHEYFEQRRNVYPISQDVERKTGRPQKWTEDERRERQRLYSQVHYYRSQADKYAAKGQLDKAEKAANKAKEIRARLKNG